MLFWQVWRCDEILFVLQNNMDDLNATFPQCVQAGDNLGNLHTIIRADVDQYPLGYASSVRATFGMVLWIALVLHIFGVEIYVRNILTFQAP